jgi:hypothetical protein
LKPSPAIVVAAQMRALAIAGVERRALVERQERSMTRRTGVAAAA